MLFVDAVLDFVALLVVLDFSFVLPPEFLLPPDTICPSVSFVTYVVVSSVTSFLSFLFERKPV